MKKTKRMIKTKVAPGEGGGGWKEQWITMILV